MFIDHRHPSRQTNADNRAALRIATIALAILVALAVFLPKAGNGPDAASPSLTGAAIGDRLPSP